VRLGEAGARLDTLLANNGDGSLLVYARGAWAYDRVTNPGLLATFQAALAPGALPGSGVGFTVDGAVVPKSLALAAGGAEFRFMKNWSLLADFRGEFGVGAGAQSQTYSGTGTLRYHW